MRAWLCLLLVLAYAAPVAADEDVRDLYGRATAHFNLGRYKEAATEYEHVYELHPDPVLLYDIAQSYRLLGVPEKAIFYYRSYLRNSPHAPNIAEVQGRISDLETALQSQQKLQTPPNEAVAPKPNPNATTPPAPPPPSPSTVTPPPPQATPQPPARTARHDDRPLYKKWWFWTAVGGGVVVVAVVVGVSVAVTSGNGFAPTVPDAGPGLTTTSLKVRF